MTVFSFSWSPLLRLWRLVSIILLYSEAVSSRGYSMHVSTYPMMHSASPGLLLLSFLFLADADCECNYTALYAFSHTYTNRDLHTHTCRHLLNTAIHKGFRDNFQIQFATQPQTFSQGHKRSSSATRGTRSRTTDAEAPTEARPPLCLVGLGLHEQKEVMETGWNSQNVTVPARCLEQLTCQGPKTTWKCS